MTLTRDCFGRVVTTHACPSCGSRFLGPAQCHPSPANGFAHPDEIETLPVYGCDEPPAQRWAVALPVIVLARNEEQAYKMAAGVVADQFPARVVERYGGRFHPLPLESREQAAARNIAAPDDQDPPV